MVVPTGKGRFYCRISSTAGFLGFLDLRPKNVSCTRLADTNHALTSYEMGTTNPTVFVSVVYY